MTDVQLDFFENFFINLAIDDNISSFRTIETTEKTVEVEYTFKGYGVQNITHPIITNEDICEMIKNDEDINLDFCYINNFNYRTIAKLLNRRPILKNFTSRLTFFDGNTSFDNALFDDEDISFQFAHFVNGSTSFNNANFGDGDTSFLNVSFSCKSLTFNFTDFNDGFVAFDFSNFSAETVSFIESTFRGDFISFEDTTFSSKNVTFYKNNLGHADISFEKCNASKSEFKFLRCKLLCHENLRFANVRVLEIIDCIVDGTLVMDSSSDTNVYIEQITFKNTKNLGIIFLDWERIKKAIALYGIDKPMDKYTAKCLLEEKASQLQMLKKNFNNLGEYDIEDDAFVEYMRYNAKTQPPLRRFNLNLLDLIGCYGTKPIRVFATMLVLVLAFAGIFSGFIPFIQVSEHRLFDGYIRGLYFSIITFFTIGYGDITPASGPAAVFAGVEGFLGVFFMSYFTVSIVRKTLR